MILFSCPIPFSAFFFSSKPGLKVHVSMAHMTVTNKLSKNFTDEQVRKSELIYKRLVGRKIKRKIDDKFTAYNSPCNQSQFSYHFLHTQHVIWNFYQSDAQPAPSMQAKENQKAIVSLFEGFLCLRQFTSKHEMDSLLMLLKSRNYAPSEFRIQNRTMKRIRKNFDSYFEVETLFFGFVGSSFKPAGNLTYAVYSTGSTDALEIKISACSLENFSFTFGQKKFFPDHFNAEIVMKACVAVWRAIPSRNKFDTAWIFSLEDGTTTSVGCIWIFRDKSLTSMSAGSPRFCPLNITLLNIV